MKASDAQVRAATAAPPPDIRLYLFYGPDEAAAHAFAARLAVAMGPDAERIDLDPATLRGDPALLADEAAALSLFGGARHIRIVGAGDEVTDAVAGLLAAERAGNPAVVIAPSLRATGKLAKLALAAPAAMVHACYVPTGHQAEALASSLAREHGLTTTGRTAARLVEASGGDRAVMARELEKLALFLDADGERPRELDDDALDAVGADLEDTGLFAAIDAAVAGDVTEVGHRLAMMADGGGSPIPLLRQLVRRLLSIGDGSSGGYGRGRGGDDRAARLWSPSGIARAVDHLRQAERGIMSSATAGDVLAAAAVLAVARTAARRR